MKIKLICPKRHIKKIDFKIFEKAINNNTKLKCSKCKKLIDPVKFKVHADSVSDVNNALNSAKLSEPKEEIIEESTENNPINESILPNSEPNEEIIGENKENTIIDRDFEVEFPKNNEELTNNVTEQPKNTNESFIKDTIKEDSPPIINRGKFKDLTVETILDLAFNTIAERRGDFWKLSNDEKATFCKLTTKILNKHVGVKLGRYSDEISLSVSFLAITFKKILQDRKINKGKETIPNENSNSAPVDDRIVPLDQEYGLDQ